MDEAGGDMTSNGQSSRRRVLWAAVLPESSVGELGRLRWVPGWRQLHENEHVWLCGDERLTEDARRRLLAIGGLRLFDVGESGELTPLGRLTPVGSLPVSDAWSPLRECVQPILPAAGFTASRLEPARVELVRCDTARDSHYLLAAATDWAAFAGTAPRIRLDRLEFAASADRRVLIHGHPLPFLSGQSYWELGRMLIPAGWELNLSIDPAAMCEILGLADDERALFHADPTRWERVPADAFIPARREHVRASARQFADWAGE